MKPSGGNGGCHLPPLVAAPPSPRLPSMHTCLSSSVPSSSSPHFRDGRPRANCYCRRHRSGVTWGAVVTDRAAVCGMPLWAEAGSPCARHPSFPRHRRARGGCDLPGGQYGGRLCRGAAAHRLCGRPCEDSWRFEDAKSTVMLSQAAWTPSPYRPSVPCRRPPGRQLLHLRGGLRGHV